MKRRFRPFEDKQKLALVAMEAFQRLVEGREGRFFKEYLVKSSLNHGLGAGGGILFVFFQAAVEIPYLRSLRFQVVPVLPGEADQLRDGSLRVYPAEHVGEHVELPSVVAEDRDVRIEAVLDHGTDERAFRRDPDMAGARDSQLRQMREPVLLGRKYGGAGLENRADRVGRKLLGRHVRQGVGVDDVVFEHAAENLQKVDPALAFGTLEIGENFVADVGAVAVFPVMPRPGVVHVQIPGNRDAGPEDFLLLGVEGVLALQEDSGNLAQGNVAANLAKLLPDRRLRRVDVVVLAQNEAAELDAEVPSVEFRRKTAHDVFAVGRFVAGQPVPDVERLESQILNHEIVVALETASLGNVIGLDHLVLVDMEGGRLLPFPGARFGAGRLGRPLPVFRLLFKLGGLDFGALLQSLQCLDLVLQDFNLFGLLLNEFQEPNDKGRLFFIRNGG